MQVSGWHDFAAPRERVWAALRNPAVLERAVPGCQSLERVGANTYAVTVAAGVASIPGVYSGTVALHDLDPPRAYTLHATGQGGPGTFEATARVRLEYLERGGTRVSYDADAVFGGTIAGVGQRVLGAVAKRNAEQFFAAVEAALAAPAAEPAPPAEPRSRALDPLSMLVGAAIAVAGVLLGRWARR